MQQSHSEKQTSIGTLANPVQNIDRVMPALNSARNTSNVALNESALSIGPEIQKKAEQNGSKRNLEMSPTSSHCEVND